MMLALGCISVSRIERVAANLDVVKMPVEKQEEWGKAGGREEKTI